MNYVPFVFVESIHAEKHDRLRTYQRRHNDGHLPQPALLPDPIGLLAHQVFSMLYRVVAGASQALLSPMPAGHEVASSSLPVVPQQQPQAGSQ